jgi:hypothetical protein
MVSSERETRKKQYGIRIGVKRLIAVSLIAILISGCGKSAIPQLSVPLFKPKTVSILETKPLYSMTPLDSDMDIIDRFLLSAPRGSSCIRFECICWWC